MKILLIHNSYQRAGGEDAVFKIEAEVFRSKGHDVFCYEISNDRISGFFGKFCAALGVIFSPLGFVKTCKLIKRIRPAVVHVHNFFPLISPSIFYACKFYGVPVVHTLHNFRIICPTATLMHDDKVTLRSLSEGPWWALRHRVYRDSYIATFFLCLMIWVHGKLGTWKNIVSKFIVLSDFSRKIFEEAGIPASKLFIKHNSIIEQAIAFDGKRAGFLFVGRLSKEKGVDVLGEAALCAPSEEKFEICVVGSGPLDLSPFEGVVNCLGQLDKNEINFLMQSSSALIVPSICFEGFPMVLVEAYANSLPVIGSRLGALAELIDDGVTGLLFEPGNPKDLLEKMCWANSHPKEMLVMGKNARAAYINKYTSQMSYEKLMSVYADVIGGMNE